MITDCAEQCSEGDIVPHAPSPHHHHHHICAEQSCESGSNLDLDLKDFSAVTEACVVLYLRHVFTTFCHHQKEWGCI